MSAPPILWTFRRAESDPFWNLTSDRDVATAEIEQGSTVHRLYTNPLFTPAERQYLLRLLGGSLDGECGLKAEGVLVLRGKLEGMG